MGIGPWEVFIILVVLVVVLGVGRLSLLGSAARQSVREFRGAVREQPAPAAPPPPAVPPITCPNCETVNLGTNKFCASCGTPLQPLPAEPETLTTVEGKTCPSCATVNPPGQAFCGQCGTRLSEAP
jgi:hypothetical protein